MLLPPRPVPGSRRLARFPADLRCWRSGKVTSGSHSRVSGNVNHGEIRVNGLHCKSLRTECALRPRLVSDCFQGDPDTTLTQLVGRGATVPRSGFVFGSEGMRRANSQTFNQRIPDRPARSRRSCSRGRCRRRSDPRPHPRRALLPGNQASPGGHRAH